MGSLLIKSHVCFVSSQRLPGSCWIGGTEDLVETEKENKT